MDISDEHLEDKAMELRAQRIAEQHPITEEQQKLLDADTTRFIVRMRTWYPLYWSSMKILNHVQGVKAIKELIYDIKRQYSVNDEVINSVKPNPFMIARALRAGVN